ncbi:MAG: magnesium/cobalt transporter CorA [Fimbriiglobus sp.]|nr:magnesium/cobalt transporter CorA [Fimbriiglobus sp.]
MIHILRWETSSNTAEVIPLERLPATAVEVGESVYWIDLDAPTPEEEERVLRRFHCVHPLTLEDITKPRRDPGEGAHLPKVEEFPDYLFVIVNPLPADLCRVPPPVNCEPTASVSGLLTVASRLAKARSRPQLSAVLTHNVLITHHYAPLPCVQDGQKYLARHADGLARGPDYVFHLILDGIVDEYAPVVERISDRLDRLERRLFTRPSAELIARLLRLKRQVSFLRKTLLLEREVLARLIRGEFRLVEARELVYYRNVYDHLVRYTELIEAAREMVSDLMQSHLSATSNKLNEVMKALTMISTVGLVCGLIAGIYGMNFENLPGLKWEHGFAFALGLMAASAMAAFVFFRWKKWV